LKCIEAGSVVVSHPQGSIPIFYLPGVSYQQLNDAENCPKELQPLVEYLYRGSVWHHPNGRDWTPFAFLSSEPGGLELDISNDEVTKAAMSRALPMLMGEKAQPLSRDHIDADYINHLLAPDFTRDILNWMNNPGATKRRKGKEEWAAFVDQSEREYRFHPERDGSLRAALLLAERKDAWKGVWDRFTESPQNYPELIRLMRQIDTPKDLPESDLETFPAYNDAKEKELANALVQLKGKRRDEVVDGIVGLEKVHGHRRDWVWSRVQQSQFACALEHLVKLATLTDKPLNAATSSDLAELYAKEGVKVDSELLDTLACCLISDHEEPIKEVSHSLYYSWLDISSKNIQNSIKREGNRITPKLEPVQAMEGRLILFVDGLRFDLAQRLKDQLLYMGHNVDISWDWSPMPTITQTGKYYVSPVNHLLTGNASCTDLTPLIAESDHVMTSDRFTELMKKNGIAVVDSQSTGDPDGRAWTESGRIDHAGHSDGWELARRIRQELTDVALRIDNLMKAGWREVLVVTDHGWIMVPLCFTRIELPKYLTDYKWGRCALLKETAQTEFPLVPWFWSDSVSVSSPPGAGCFRDGMQFTHGGISLQELVVPRILVKTDSANLAYARISEHRWIGLRCQIRISNPRKELKVDIRKRIADTESSLIEGKAPRGITSDGTVSLPAANSDDEGKDAFLVLLDKEENILHSIPTKIGGGS